MNPITIVAPAPMILDIEVRRGAGGDAAAIAIVLPTRLGPDDVVRFEVRHGMRLILCRRSDDGSLEVAADGRTLTWSPTPDDTRAIRSGRVDRYAFDLFRPNLSLGPVLTGFLVGLDA